MGHFQHVVWLAVILAAAAVLPDTPERGSPANQLDPKEHRKSSIVLNTKQGKLRGSVIKYGDYTYSRFLGVPYAKPPVEDLRFSDPKKHLGWPLAKIWNATYFRPSCIQDIQNFSKIYERHYGTSRKVSETKTSEDCLYLNLYIPRNLSDVEHINTLSLSVMILIQGADFANEIAAIHEGWRLAGRGDVIVATVQYRVGVFGFFSLLDELARGNFGLLDQKMAMHWIWDNIREFGGNPESITIFGGGTGGVSVGFHVVSPVSRGMFIRAISHSGTMLTPSAIQDKPVEASKALAETVSCPINPYRRMLECLRKVSPEQLLDAQEEVSQYAGRFRPVVDGKFLPDDPLKLLDAGQFNPVDYLLGINSHDGYSVVDQLNLDLKSGLSQDDYEDLMTLYLNKYYDNNVDVIRSAMLLEYASCGRDAAQLGREFIAFITDLDFAGPVDLTARLMTRKGERRVFFYQFAHKPSFVIDHRPSHIEAIHGEEMPFVMGDVHGTEEEGKLSIAMMRAWANFARNGDPNSMVPGLFWEPYNVAQGKYAHLTTNLGKQSSRSSLRARKMAFWNSYVDQLRRAAPCEHERDTCERSTRPLRQRESHAFLSLWVLAGLCVILVIIVILLIAKIRLPPSSWRKCCPCFYPVQKEANTQEAERKKLHPLPYYEEPT